MLGRIGLLENGGGDRIQVEHTAEELRRLGLEVDVKTEVVETVVEVGST